MSIRYYIFLTSQILTSRIVLLIVSECQPLDGLNIVPVVPTLPSSSSKHSRYTDHLENVEIIDSFEVNSENRTISAAISRVNQGKQKIIKQTKFNLSNSRITKKMWKLARSSTALMASILRMFHKLKN